MMRGVGVPCLTLAMCFAGCDVSGLLGGRDKKADPTPTSEPGQPTLIGTNKPSGGGRSAVPSTVEFDAVGEVTVKGSSALGCQTKMVREWLRVSCSGKNDTGGKPTTVTVDKGASSERFTFAQNGVTSLVTPFEDGTQVEATFSWTDKSHKLVVSWPRGAPRPPVVGVFQGASSPLDPKACIECADEGDAARAKKEGKKCCDPKSCRSAAECPTGHFCCLGPLAPGQCRSGCDMANTTPVCSSDADCPAPFGKKLVCKPHPSGLKNCQSK